MPPDTSPTPRGQVLSMGACYAMGTFNDNFFKQAALLLAVTAGQNLFQGNATFLFALPFILFSARAGWLADRFPKKTLIVGAKSLELAAMLIGAWGLIALDWNWLLGMIFCMGLSSALFSPALNGSIPEIFPSGRVPGINALFKLATTATILPGIAMAGAALDQRWLPTERPFGLWLVACIAVGAALLGLACTPLIARRPGAGSRNRFPWTGPVEAFRHLYETRADRALLLALLGEAFFYFLSTLLLLFINNLGGAQLGFSYSATSTLSIALLAGICAGSLLAARGTSESWKKLLVPSALGIALLLGLVSLIPAAAPPRLLLPLLLGTYGLAGLCGGLYLIPLTSFIQVRPRPTDKGRILGVSNSLSFTGILLAGQIFLLLGPVRPSTGHLLLGVVTLLAAAGFGSAIRRLKAAEPPAPPVPATPADPAGPAGAASSSARPPRTGGMAFSLLPALLRGLLRLRYRIRVEGLDAIPAPATPAPNAGPSASQARRPIVFAPNHPALIDPVILYAVLGGAFRPRPLADAHQADRPGVRALMRLVRAIVIPDLRRDGRAAEAAVEAAITAVIGALRDGDNVLFYPSGRLTRTGLEEPGGNRGLRMILDALPEARVVRIRTRGLWGSSFSRARGSAPDLAGGLLRGAGWLLANLIFFMPRRDVRIVLSEEPLRSRQGDGGAQALNRELEAFYNAEPEPALDVPRHFLAGSVPVPLPALPDAARAGGAAKAALLAAVPADVRARVGAFLREESGVETLSDDMSLAGDLGVDSLALTGISLWLEETFGRNVDDMEALNTVGDCLLAAAGRLGAAGAAPLKAPPAWFDDADPSRRLAVPAGEGIPRIIARQAALNPRRIMIADRDASLTYSAALTRALALAAAIRRLPEKKRVGIMLPASPAAAVTWLAALLAGKTPVMCNWTTGERNFRHGLEQTGVRRVLTSRLLLERLGRQGFRSEAAGAAWVALEDLAAGLTPRDKLAAVLKGRLCRLPGLLPGGKNGDIAAILFTSGSECLPKAVPLTHANIIANCRDIAQVLGIRAGDRMLGMLPPFHSLGLTGNIVLPLVFGLPVVYHPNPTEAARLAELAGSFGATLTVAPPTFLGALLQQAKEGDLASLRLAFVGAEKCPEHVYAAFAEATDGVLCEGYGVTECAPVVSVNRPEDARPGTIGLPLPSVRVAVVEESDEREPRRVAPGKTGMLLVSGPNVFPGYPGRETPFVDFEGASWYRTGDLAAQDEDGFLTFRGRLKRFVKIGGEMISLPQIEQTLLAAFADPDRAKDGPQANPARRGGSGAAAGESGPLLAVESIERAGEKPLLVLFAAFDVSRKAANAALREAGLSGLHAISRVERLEHIPVLGSGKTDYQSLRAKLAGSSPEAVPA